MCGFALQTESQTTSRMEQMANRRDRYAHSAPCDVCGNVSWCVQLVIFPGKTQTFFYANSPRLLAPLILCSVRTLSSALTFAQGDMISEKQYFVCFLF